MKVLVVSGFLGSGKTTWIKYLTDISSKPFVILENEYADINLDAPLLKADAGDVSVWEMTEGCICCTAGSDFATSVLTIANSLDPDYLIVEPTGVALLSNVLLSLKRIEYERITILPPVSIVDGLGFLQNAGLADGLIEDQIRHAGIIVVSKNENMEAKEKERLYGLLREMNEGAEIVIDHYSTKPSSWWEELLKMEAAEIEVVEMGPQFSPDRMSLRKARLGSHGSLVYLLEKMLRGAYGHMIRAKGSVKIDGAGYLRFDLAAERYTIEEITEAELDEYYGSEAKGAVVFIGLDLNEEKIKRDFLPGYSLFVTIPADKKS